MRHAGALCGLVMVGGPAMTIQRRWQVLYRLGMEDMLLTLHGGGSRCSVLSCYGWRTCHDYVKEMAGALWVVHGGLAVNPP